MSPWIIASLSYIGIVLLRGLISFIKFRTLSFYHEKYHQYIDDPDNSFHQYKQQIISLFKNAGIEDFVIPRLTNAGYGHVRKDNLSGFRNLTLLDGDFVPQIERIFNEAKGVFKHRAKQSINPIFWIEFLITLPQHALGYFDVNPKNTFGKVLQVLYWITAILVGLQNLGWIKII